MTHMIALCDAASRQVRRGGSGRALFDATIARLCMAGQFAEAGTVLSTGVPKSTPNKKKSLPAKVKVEEVPQPKQDTLSTPPSELTWESLHAIIESTPGLKKIAQHLQLSSLEGQKLVITIAETGRDSTNYILGQRQRIEQILLKEVGQKFKVIIESNSNGQPAPTVEPAFDAVEDNQLVQTARGLFEGTIVQVKNLEEDEA